MPVTRIFRHGSAVISAPQLSFTQGDSDYGQFDINERLCCPFVVACPTASFDDLAY
jgi:hypothetical protein